MVAREELRENDDNLNIRRYADNAPPPEPHDVRAHLFGGIPKAEVEAQGAVLTAHGFDPLHLLGERDERYFDFIEAVADKGDIKRLIEEDVGVRAKEEAVGSGVEAWWTENVSALRDLPKTEALMELRTQLLSTFECALRPAGLLDRFRVSGVIATWWGDVQNDLKTIAARGFQGLLEAWETSILTAMEDKKSKDNPLDHRLVKRLLPEYLDSISELEAKKAELDATIKGANAADDDEEDGDAEEQLSADELKALKKELSALKKRLKAKEGNFTKRLGEARSALDEESARDLVLGILYADLDAILARYIADHRQQVVAAFEQWWDKYRVTLKSMEEERDSEASTLRDQLARLGYA